MENQRKTLFSETRKDLLNRQLSNSQNVDRAILSISTAGLGFLLTIKKYFSAGTLNNEILNLFYYASILFLISIYTTLASFITSNWAINKQLFFAEQYYLKEKDEYAKKRNWPSLCTNFLYYLSIIIFCTAILLTFSLLQKT